MDDAKYLVTANEIKDMKGLSKAHFLNANARRVNKSLGDLTGLTGIGVHLIEVEPGCETTEHHVHYHEDECVYVLDGEAIAVIGEDEFAIGPGDFIGYRKGGLSHSILNTGARILRCLVIGERQAHDVGDYPHQAKRIYRHEGLPWNVVDHEAISTPNAGAKK